MHPLRPTPSRRRRRRRFSPRATALLVVTATALSAAACHPGHSGTTGGGPAPARPSALQGLWRTEGYGTVVSVDGRHLRTYETTRISCLPGRLEADRTGPPRTGGAADFTPRDPEEAGRITLTPNASDHGRTAWFRFADDAGYRTLRRIRKLPRDCRHKPSPSADPRAVFDVFWRTYAENYPSFQARGVDWNAVRDRCRPTVTAKTGDGRLFATLKRMIEPLHDAHTALDTGHGRRFAGRRKGTRIPTRDTIATIEKATAAHVGVPQQHWGQGALGYADLSGRTGYLRVTRFTHLTRVTGKEAQSGYARDEAELDEALDAVFTRRRTHGPHALRGLVIDLRFNGGGADPLGLRLASRLTDRAYPAYTKRARDDAAGPGRFTPPQRIQVTPYRGGPVYTGPLVVLTGRLTVSAGETFTQALMGREPAPTRIGENTQGAFSDTMDRTLPNGWSFTLPNEQFRTPDGRTFDATGIPPTLRTPVFTDEEFAAHRDSALARARALLE